MSPVPTTIFSGFLGSGKTTLISHLVDQLQSQGQQVVYIKNEIGDTDLDSKILKGKHIQTKELLNGCICCTLVGPFTQALEEIVSQFHPDRIIVEASGAADPAALALMVDSHPLLHRDGVIGVIDVVNFEGFAELTTTAKNQTRFVDLLVFNKVELADDEHKQQVVGYVRELNTHSPIIEAPHGRLDRHVVFGLDSKELSTLLETAEHGHDHVAADDLHSLTFRPAGSTTREQFTQTFSNLPKQVFRTKGLVFLEDGQVYVFNTVAQRLDLQPAPDNLANAENLIICIGWKIHQLEGELEQVISACFTSPS